MSNEVPTKRLGFASFFSSDRERSIDVSTSRTSPPLSRATVSLSNNLNGTTSQSLQFRGQAGLATSSPRSDLRSVSAPCKTSRSLRNYKCLLDPELDRSLAKGTKPVFRYNGKSVSTHVMIVAPGSSSQKQDTHITVTDPRSSRDYAMQVAKGKKKYRPVVRRLYWARDENSVGPDPPVALLASNLSPLTTVQEIIMQFRVFGELAETKLQIDPSNGASLGLCRVVYRKNPKSFEIAVEAAKKAIKTMNMSRLGGTRIHVEFDDDGEKCQTKVQRLIVEREENRALAALAAKAQQRKSSPAASFVVPPKGPKMMHREDSVSRESRERDGQDERKVETKKYGRESSFRIRDSSRISNSASETNERIGYYAYIFISERVLPLHKVTAQELQIHFSGKRNRDLFTDQYGFYVLFDNDDIATHAHRTMHKSTFLGYRLYMDLHMAKKPPAQITQKPLGHAFKKTFQPVENIRDPISETTNRLIKELQDVFLRDVRSRVAGPALLEFLDPSQFKTSKKSTKTNANTLQPHAIMKPSGAVDINQNNGAAGEPKSKKLADVLMNMPRRKREKKADQKSGRMRLSHRMDHHAMYSDASDGSDDDSREVKSDRPSSIAPSIDLEEDGDNTPMRGMKAKVASRATIVNKESRDLPSESEMELAVVREEEPRHSKRAPVQMDIDLVAVKDGTPGSLSRRHEVDFTSSSEDESLPDLDTRTSELDSNPEAKPEVSISYQIEVKEELMPDAALVALDEHDREAISKKSKGKLPKRRPVVEKKLKKPVALQVRDVAEESSSAQESSDEESLEPTAALNSTIVEEDEVVLDLDGIQSIVKDEEDFRLLSEVLRDVRSAPIKDISLWAWQQKETKASHADGMKGVIKQQKDSGYQRVNETGAAKTEGWYPIPDVEKSFYLPNRNRAVVTEPGLSSTSSRMNRANNRRQAAGIEAQRQTLDAQTDLLRFNALKSRKKQLKFSRSAIHDWGLYALEPIEKGEMVIEYVGEIIRQQVADHREKRYERSGIGSSYLFRIDEEFVIDATKSGNIARFINHSCDPSCTAKIITVYGQKKIVIYAQRDIALGEEITYDYKFPLEDEKIPCLCGSIICRKYLN